MNNSIQRFRSDELVTSIFITVQGKELLKNVTFGKTSGLVMFSLLLKCENYM